ncbi:hypothetical protein WA026_019749 [Henosepilachna vigintioctopunctata]|uniref:Uncharacterized protein n=1 Tax=Henosepilachna vigintioctopunctata TaxID=420089 RepID=A0AAW1UI89_9CUCU
MLEKDSSCNTDKALKVVQWAESPVLKPDEDELMNYAIIGSQREENLESPKSGNKRKCNPFEDQEPLEKKCKTEQRQALLKKIDVDTFLNKVHGNADKVLPSS